MKSKIFITLLTIAFSLGNVHAQNLNKAKLDSLLDILAKNNKAMGSLTVSKKGTVLYSRAIGYGSISEKEKKAAVTTTKYRIGSISKTFTATLIFQLIDEGKIMLTSTLDNYFPQLPNAKLITISNLLNHRSGLHNFTANPDYMTWMTQPKTQDEMLKVMTANKPDFQPNEKFAYSNTNYVILGYIIEKIAKKPYSKVLNEKITIKIGLTNTYYGGKINTKNNESSSYKWINGWQIQPETDMSIPGGAGAVVSTPTDLTKFMEALFALKLVSQNSLNQMKTLTDGYGMGMFQMPFYTRKGYGHNGSIDGFKANVGYFPEDSLSIAYCTNGEVHPLNDILIGVLSISFNRTYVLPVFSTLTLKTEDLDKYLGVYASTQIPLKITVTKADATLMAQATGQSSFPLEATEKDKFSFDQAGIKMEFNPSKNEMTLKQGGNNYVFTKEK
ncbi:MAG: beta-lactamase family protein [Verrucomicrobia bacterium]|nr:beta-lactamase family protein [Cytophagales bacterium]